MNDLEGDGSTVESGRQSWPPPRLYLASLSDYNAGRLHGAWVPAAIGAEAIHAGIQEMLSGSKDPGAEEWAIHDYEGFGPLHLPEYMAIETAALLAEGIVEHGPAFAYWAAHLGSSCWTDDLQRFEDQFVGHFDSMAEFAEYELDMHGVEVDEIGPEELRPYLSFNLDAYARDLGAMFNISQAENGEVYVFWPQ